MIALSRSRVVVAAAALALSSLLVESCESHGCNDIGCDSGLTVALTGGAFDGGAPADRFDIVIDQQIDNNFVMLMTCAFAVNTHQLLCNSAYTHRETDSTIRFSATDLRTIRVTVSAAGNQISQQVFEPAWVSREVWGAGCGYCTQAAITVELPSHG
jgi:hypothetical protein